MFERTDARRPDDLFLPMSGRNPRGTYFARVCGWSDEAQKCVRRFYEAASRRGVVIDGGLQNPDGMQLGYLSDTLGPDFRADEGFIADALARWLPAMAAENRRDFARLLCGHFADMRAGGKPEGVLKNLYAKLMCWLYYRFARLMPLLGEDDPPRVLIACAELSAHELVMLRLLNGIGADIMLILTAGEDGYLRRDPESRHSQRLFPDAGPFPEGWRLKALRQEAAELPKPKAVPAARPAPRKIDPMDYFQKPSRQICTNAWMEQADCEAILTPAMSRGSDPGLYYNAFIRMTGVKDRLTFPGELHRFYRRLTDAGRPVVIVDEGLSLPGPEEVAQIRRRNYRRAEEMIVDLANNLPKCADADLERMLQRAFVTTMLGAVSPDEPLNRLTVSAVYLLCWIRRWHRELFRGDMPCFILMGGCKTAQEALYPLFLSRLPVDVLILAPDLNRPCVLSDPRLLELRGEASLPMARFPRDAGSLQTPTVAARAEEELTDMLYSGSGLYRSMQFSRAEAMTLQTTYDELFLLWNEELKYRPGFAAVDQTVTMPVVYARISGVEGGRVEEYWRRVGQLAEGAALVCRGFPMAPDSAPNPFQPLAIRALRGGVLRRNALREDRQYPFGIIREEMQDHMLDKLQLMLDRQLIKGTFENGAEYAVVATILNLDKGLIRALQSFDFTRRSPKAVCVCADDAGARLEDAILLTFLNLVGFDVALFVPTGYQTIERWLNDNLPVEYRAGEYMYDLTVPGMDELTRPRKRGWLDNLFNRGH